MVLRVFLAIVMLLLSPGLVQADIVKTGVPRDGKIMLFWWPKLAVPKGWHFDKGSSHNFGMNALAPDGATFSDAETVIYARAIYKPHAPKDKSLADFTVNAVAQFINANPGYNVKTAGELATADGKSWTSYHFSPETAGNWERVVYGEEGDFYLVFVLSSRNQKGFAANGKAFEKMLASYRE